jgi:release factor H-coupled RctB family protein
LSAHAADHGAAPVPAGSDAGVRYLRAHDAAVAWAAANRRLVARRVADALEADAALVLDSCHNLVEPMPHEGGTVWLHRKGAAPADRGPVVIPGSRGSFSYLVDPVPTWAALRSVAHGAGRRLAREDARGKLAGRYRRDELRRTALGSVVVCGRDDLLLEEAPAAYKDIEAVIACLEDAGLVRVIAVLRPRLTFKTSAKAERHGQRNDHRHRERAAARSLKAKGGRP